MEVAVSRELCVAAWWVMLSEGTGQPLVGFLDTTDLIVSVDGLGSRWEDTGTFTHEEVGRLYDLFIE